MNRVTVNLEPGIRRELDRIAAREGVSRSDVLRAALEDFVFMRRFRALRQRMTTVAQTQGIVTDEDVFDRIAAARCPSRRPKVTLLVSTDPRLGEESELYKNLRE
jgi:metal-responsive CopG/Arc/MetJ family transcriptional regulator